MKRENTENTVTTKTLENMFTVKHTGKMSGMISLSTSVLKNPHCAARRENGEMICKYCFAAAQMKRYANMQAKFDRNTDILNAAVYPVDMWPIVNASLFRLESFGDLMSANQVENYFNLCKRNPHTAFALWTKNPGYLLEAINQRGNAKPKNLTIVYSSPLVDHAQKNVLSNIYAGIIDKVFTVYKSEETAAAAGEKINCGARHCLSCRRCYSKKTASTVNELLK